MNHRESAAKIDEARHQQTRVVGEEEARLQLNHTFVARPPNAPLQSLGGKGEPPFGQPSQLAPRVIAPVAAFRPGPQPSYHLKVTATPIHRLNDEPLKYEVVAGPTEIEDKQTTYMGTDGQVIVHARNQLHGHQAKQAAAAAGKKITVKPTNADVLADGIVHGDGTKQNVGAQTHVYAGTVGRDPRQVVNRLQEPVPVKSGDPRKPLNLEQIKRAHRREPQRSIPSHRVSIDAFLGLQKKLREKREGKSWWRFGGRKHTDDDDMDLHAHHDDEEYARALQKEIHMGGLASEKDDSAESMNNVPPDAIPLERGYSRMIPSLLQATDDERQKMYNWIMPQEGITAGANAMASGGEAAAAAAHENPALFFQGSSQLAQFLEAPEAGLLWEDDDDLFEGAEGVLKPSIVYGGVEHCPPEFAGRLTPISFKLHALELHQYMQVSGSDTPWFLKNGLNPHTQALFGPVPLPFDPANSGMPAPVFDTMTEAGQPVPRIAPLIRTFFNPELPVQYERKPEPAKKPKTVEGGEEEESASDESSALSPSAHSSSDKSGPSSPGSFEGEHLQIPPEDQTQDAPPVDTQTSIPTSVKPVNLGYENLASSSVTIPLHPQMGTGVPGSAGVGAMQQSSASSQQAMVAKTSSQIRNQGMSVVTKEGSGSLVQGASIPSQGGASVVMPVAAPAGSQSPNRQGGAPSA
eukprot:Blabericola_migrator_1__10882@NODE_627_length_7181_cov_106_322322_g458_i0_p1_GENE_NODE_627_length_7181_cov_106_322322_g458_i0NODE_627_length_7181_cov_106_322322_g458_i0_p1_ORF_typecomplete_len691_score163_19_NODE_627_length_7181_cov_106_322322_g458_i06422714